MQNKRQLCRIYLHDFLGISERSLRGQASGRLDSVPCLPPACGAPSGSWCIRASGIKLDAS